MIKKYIYANPRKSYYSLQLSIVYISMHIEAYVLKNKKQAAIC